MEPEMWIQAGLFWDAEPDAVRPVYDSLELATRNISTQAVAAGDVAEWIKLHQRCWLAIADLGRDGGIDPAATAALAREAQDLATSLNVSRRPGLCASFLEALAAIQAGDPSAPAKVAQADSVFGMGVRSRYQAVWLMVLSDMYAAVGEKQRALDLLRRVWMVFGEEHVQFLAPRLLRRARLAAELGYRDEAIQAYQHYLTLRSDPEPVLTDQAESVRGELAGLLGE